MHVNAKIKSYLPRRLKGRTLTATLILSVDILGAFVVCTAVSGEMQIQFAKLLVYSGRQGINTNKHMYTQLHFLYISSWKNANKNNQINGPTDSFQNAYIYVCVILYDIRRFVRRLLFLYDIKCNVLRLSWRISLRSNILSSGWTSRKENYITVLSIHLSTGIRLWFDMLLISLEIVVTFLTT